MLRYNYKVFVWNFKVLAFQFMEKSNPEEGMWLCIDASA